MARVASLVPDTACSVSRLCVRVYASVYTHDGVTARSKDQKLL